MMGPGISTGHTKRKEEKYQNPTCVMDYVASLHLDYKGFPILSIDDTNCASRTHSATFVINTGNNTKLSSQQFMVAISILLIPGCA